MFRTEMLYMDRTSAPGESELYNIFCQALESARRTQHYCAHYGHWRRQTR
ncbi:hypothetical protein HTZ85_11315 [Escherichia coli]|nr:hypothetical protein [Escherichia coli]